MGKIDQIEQMENYIKDLGDEIKHLKKASDYLKLIEEFQEEVKKTSSNLKRSENQLNHIQELIESRLALYQITAQNIELKLKAIEQLQIQLIAGIADIKQNQQNSEKRMTSSFSETNKLVNENNKDVVSTIKNTYEANETHISELAKKAKTYFIVNIGLGVCILGTIVFLLVR